MMAMQQALQRVRVTVRDAATASTFNGASLLLPVPAAADATVGSLCTTVARILGIDARKITLSLDGALVHESLPVGVLHDGDQRKLHSECSSESHNSSWSRGASDGTDGNEHST